jgi:hypothetical protein
MMMQRFLPRTVIRAGYAGQRQLMVVRRFSQAAPGFAAIEAGECAEQHRTSVAVAMHEAHQANLGLSCRDGVA